MPDIINNINWLDIIYAFLLFGMLYKGMRTGVGAQILSLVGWFALLFVSIRYYTVLSEAIFGFLLQTWAKPISFFIIISVFFILIKLLERIFSVITSDEMSALERIGGVFLSAVKAVILFGVISIQLMLMPVDFFRDSVINRSRSAMYFVTFDATIYNWIDSNIKESENTMGVEDLVKSFVKDGPGAAENAKEEDEA